MRMRWNRRVWTVLIVSVVLIGLVSAAGCLRGAHLLNANRPTVVKHSKSAPVTFTCIPLESNAYSEIIPLGNLNPPGHTFPSEFINFVLINETGSEIYDVRAPAAGVITGIKYNPYTVGNVEYDDYDVRITHTNTFESIFYHLSDLNESILDKAGDLMPNSQEWVPVSLPVEAGEVFGKAKVRPGEYTLAWLVVNWEGPPKFIHPETYPPRTAYAVCPLDYLTDSLKNEAFQKVKRTDEPRGGKIDFDMLGRLSGNWFLEGGEPCVWNYNNHLAIVYHWINASQIVVSIGGTVLSPLPVGVFNATGPDPMNVSAENGTVTYLLVGDYPDEINGTKYTLIARVVGDEKIRVEAFEGHQEGKNFTENAKFYTRTGPLSPWCELMPVFLVLLIVFFPTYAQQPLLLYGVAGVVVVAAAVILSLAVLRKKR